MSRTPRRKAKPEAAAPPIEAPRFVAPVPDSPVDLAHPIEYVGRTFARIIRHRPDSGVLGRWFEQFAEGGEPMTCPADGQPHLNMPIFVDEAGDLVPDAVLSFLDDDDRQTVFADTDPFFPKRLAAALEALTQASPPSSGGPDEPTSSAS